MEKEKLVFNLLDGRTLELELVDGTTARIKGDGNEKISMELYNKVLDKQNHVYRGDYTNPIIPKGCEYISKDWRKGITVSMVNQSIFTWLPVGGLRANGLLHNWQPNECLGRRSTEKEMSIKVIREYYKDSLSDEAEESVRKHGGFFISSFLARQCGTGIAFNDKGDPLEVSIEEAERYATEYTEGRKDIFSCLPCGAIYDTLFECFQKNDKNIRIVNVYELGKQYEELTSERFADANDNVVRITNGHMFKRSFRRKYLNEFRVAIFLR